MALIEKLNNNIPVNLRDDNRLLLDRRNTSIKKLYDSKNVYIYELSHLLKNLYKKLTLLDKSRTPHDPKHKTNLLNPPYT